MRIVLFASSDFALPLLESLNNSTNEIIAVYTQPPSISGRGLRLNYNSIAERAQELSLNLCHPVRVNESHELIYFAELEADIAIVAAYGQILSKELLSLPRFGFLNLHPSLLPRWRGAAPIERAIIEGDDLTGVCTIKMVNQLDAGPILAKEIVKIAPDITAKSLSKLLSKVGASQVLSTLNNLFTLSEIPQSTTGIKYAKKISKKETRINWNLPAEIVDRLIRGLSPSPGSWSLTSGLRVKILGSSVVDLKGNPGYRIKISKEDKSLIIGCGEKAILVSCIQKEGKRPITGEEFIRGYIGREIMFE